MAKWQVYKGAIDGKISTQNDKYSEKMTSQQNDLRQNDQYTKWAIGWMSLEKMTLDKMTKWLNKLRKNDLRQNDQQTKWAVDKMSSR